MGDEVERKGLDTPATRADIIEKLVKDGFVKREKKQMIPTEDGMKLITILPDVVKSPKLTADWENELTLVSKGEVAAEQFMSGIEAMVSDLVKTYHSVSDEQKAMFGAGRGGQEVLGKCPKCGADVVKGKFGAYCTGKCGMNVGKALGQPALEPRRCQQADVIHKARQRDKGQREPLCFEIEEHPVRAERFILFHEQPHLLQLSGNAGSPRGSRSWMLCTACSAQRQRQRLPRR